MFKYIRNTILFIMCIAGLCLISSDLPDTASTAEILCTYGGGVALLCTSLLIWSKIADKEENDNDTKGGKYYGIR